MSGARVDGVDVLASNRALREWASGLRAWSRTAREAAAAQRHRSRAIPRARPSLGETPPAPVAGAGAGGPRPRVVAASELRAVLVERHGFTQTGSHRAVAVSLLVAGYPADHPQVSGVDALDVVEHALQHRW